MSGAELVRDPGWAVGSNLTGSICEPTVRALRGLPHARLGGYGRAG
jgi:hypothetical protein